MVHNYTHQIKKHTQQGSMNRGKTLRESAISMLSDNARPLTDKGRAKLDVNKVAREGLSSKGEGFVRI